MLITCANFTVDLTEIPLNYFFLKSINAASNSDLEIYKPLFSLLVTLQKPSNGPGNK